MDSPTSTFVFPHKPLSTPHLFLEPWDPPKHAPLFFAGCKDHPHLFDYLPYGPFTSIPQFEEWCRTRIQEKPTSAAWAVYVKTQAAQTKEKWEFAGIVGLINADVQNRRVEPGSVRHPLFFGVLQQGHTHRHALSPQFTVLPPVQRTIVGSTATGLLLLFALDPPPHGLGLRRVFRLSHTANEAASRVARRLGLNLRG